MERVVGQQGERTSVGVAHRQREDLGVGRTGGFAVGGVRLKNNLALAPMAGITNAPFRTLCRRFSQDRCLYVSEMITARALVEGNRKTLLMAGFGPEETTRSLQLYGVDPHYVGEAVRLLDDLLAELLLGAKVPVIVAAGNHDSPERLTFGG